MSFEQFQLLPSLVSALGKQSLTIPTPIQVQGIPAILSGSDCYLNAATGSGKTLAYLLPLYHKLEIEKGATQFVVVAPTHELALQIHRVSCDLAQQSGLAIRSVLLIGGTSLDRQIEKLKKKPHVVIGTPGRVHELIEKGKLKVSEVYSLVIDEADRLLVAESLSMVRKIIRACPGRRQLIFVSATEQPESGKEIDQLSPAIERIRASEEKLSPNLIHYFLVCEERDKPELLRKFIHASKAEKTIVFVHRNETAEVVAAKLAHHKIPVVDLHGAYDKEERKEAMQDIRSGKVKVLLASDIAARGLDIPGITHVVNLDVPSNAKDYLHRVGRTARAGASGMALSFFTEAELRLVSRYERDLEIHIQRVDIAGGQIVVEQSAYPRE